MSGPVNNLFIASSAYLTSGADRLSAEFPGVPFTTVTTEAFASNLALFVRQSGNTNGSSFTRMIWKCRARSSGMELCGGLAGKA